MVFSYIMCCSRDKAGISWVVLWSGILFLLVLLYTLLIVLSREIYPIQGYLQVILLLILARWQANLRENWLRLAGAFSPCQSQPVLSTSAAGARPGAAKHPVNGPVSNFSGI